MEKSALFVKCHRGQRRCQEETCNKSAVGNTKFCRGHGGGIRCQEETCKKSAQGGTKFCIIHGKKHGSERRSSVRCLSVKKTKSLMDYVPSTNPCARRSCVEGNGQESMDFV